EVVVQAAGEGASVAIKPLAQGREHRRDQMQAIERAIGGVASKIVPRRPTLAGDVGSGERAAFVSQRLRETPVGRLCERRMIKECRKQGMDRHSVIIREGGGSCYGFACLPPSRSRPIGATATW